MAIYEITTEDGKVYEVETEDSTATKAVNMATDATKRIASESAKVAKEVITMGPNAQKFAANAMPFALGAAGMPFGLGAPAAAAGELGRQAINTVINPSDVPETALGRFGSVVGAGVVQQPKVLGAIPGASKVGKMAVDMASKVASKTGQGLAKAAQAFSGGKAQDFVETAKKGVSTYTKAPSVERAGEHFGKVLKSLPGEEVAPTMKETIQSALTPEASAGSKFLSDVGAKIDSGELITARDALKAKQSLDDVIDTVPFWQTKRRAKLFDLKKTFDDVLSNQSGRLKKASNTYRAAILKSNMTKFLPVNKHGEYSRLAPMLSSLGGTLAGVNSSDAKKGAGATAGYLLATSPLAMGGAAALAGSGAKTFGAMAARPEVRQALLQILQRIQQNKEGKP